jgi:catechol 2,3-dioxygenase-like lactoylglutathione lyase family enzyme
MTDLSRRELMRFLAGVATIRGSGLDHLKVRVASGGASALFYYGLFGGDIVRVENSTLPRDTPVDEFFLKIGLAPYPYLMLSQMRAGESAGFDHMAILVENALAARALLERRRVAVVDSDPGVRVRDVDGGLIELFVRPTWGETGESIRRPLPANFKSVKPAFDAVALKRVCLRTLDAAKSGDFYGELFGGETAQRFQSGGRVFTYGGTVLELVSGDGATAPRLDYLSIGVRNFRARSARRALLERGIRAYDSQRGTVRFLDPDGNDVEIVAA